MKQLIVLIAMVILGIAIAGFVMSFQESAETIAGATKSKIDMSIYDSK